MGHSDGASISLIYAGSNLPLKGLIMEAPHLMVEKITTEEIKQLYSNKKKTNLKSKLSKYHNDIESAYEKWCKIWLSEEFKNWNIKCYVKNIKVPVLAIQGKDDQYGSLEHINIIEKRLKYPFKKILIENCKHSPHIEFPKLVVDHINSFVNNIEY